MGLFGPSQAERAAQALATQPIARNQGYARHLEGSFPEFDAVVYDAIQRSGSAPQTLDLQLLKKRLVMMFMTQLERYCEGSPDLRWDNVLIVMERPDFSVSLLTDYLTNSARGVVAQNKLAGFMKTSYPEALAQAVGEGAFDQPTSPSAPVAPAYAAQNTAPGWYPDPHSGRGVRWWDGRGWTNDHRP